MEDFVKEFKKLFFLSLGIFFFLLGVIGVLLPIIPGIPFLLISLVFFVKGSKKILRLLLSNRHFGKHIRKIRKEGINKKIRNSTLTIIWLTHSFSIFYIKILPIKIFLLFSLIMVTIILLKLKTKELKYFLQKEGENDLFN